MHPTMIERDVQVPMRDGTVLRADIYRPAIDGKFPVIVLRLPYNKLVRMDGFFDFQAAVDRGFVFIVQDTRGRFSSDGEWLPWAYEREDGYDTIEWAASLPYSNGNVGTVGGSYSGSTQWSCAVMQPPHLRAIAPFITFADPDNGLLFRGGAMEMGLNIFWSFLVSLPHYPKESLSSEELFAKISTTIAEADSLAVRGYWGLPSGSPPALQHTGLPDLGVARALCDPSTKDECRVSNRYDDVKVPSLNIAGWYDIFVQGSLDNYMAMRQRGGVARLVVGPWSHVSLMSFVPSFVGDVNFGLSSVMPGGSSLTDLQLDWYEHWLKGAPATELHESSVAIFVMGINQWRMENEWPLARAKATPLYLRSDNNLDWALPTESKAESTYVYDPADPTPTCGGPQLLSGEFPAGPLEQSAVESRSDVLVFTTDPLIEDLEVTGQIRAVLFAATDGASTDWVVRLCDVDEGGISRVVVDGILRVQTEPSRVDEIEVDLWSTSMVFKAGHRIRVQVTSSCFPRWDRNPNTGQPASEATEFRSAQQRILHDADHSSRVILPVIPASSSGG